MQSVGFEQTSTKFIEIFIPQGVIHKVRMEVGEGGVMAKAYGCLEGEGDSNLVSTYAFQLYIFDF